ncbi:uncharacterized protein BDR25DRAFT_364073 [Lindgomyces ingoldianus]|uniref:Uncharacterized protein n=1 Tax=Lindgomyces ingoldianus TaxID=673940 RepID=A0ACB6Q6K8_9PLEO|nr:uncharacterized protein BDR25DRAFT_364073 [Lindgomyces ingoldianus]KAF2462489.1 hypothetical protein BDR25DRAFT_364073 [Lindgomyces ingoldianus]
MSKQLELWLSKLELAMSRREPAQHEPAGSEIGPQSARRDVRCQRLTGPIFGPQSSVAQPFDPCTGNTFLLSTVLKTIHIIKYTYSVTGTDPLFSQTDETDFKDSEYLTLSTSRVAELQRLCINRLSAYRTIADSQMLGRGSIGGHRTKHHHEGGASHRLTNSLTEHPQTSRRYALPAIRRRLKARFKELQALGDASSNELAISDWRTKQPWRDSLTILREARVKSCSPGGEPARHRSVKRLLLPEFMVYTASVSGPSERDLMVEQQRHLRKLNGHKSPGIPVMAHHLASQQTEDLITSRRGDAPVASAWYNELLPGGYDWVARHSCEHAVMEVASATTSSASPSIGWMAAMTKRFEPPADDFAGQVLELVS